jgi:hypothetical protein
MRKNTKIITSTILVFALVVSCFAAVVPMTANAAPAPVLGDPAWKAGYSTSACKGTPVSALWDRGDASGDKIPSNAHSADYPGLYFYWDDKQKEDGVLLVNENIFDYFADDYTYTLPGTNIKKDAKDFKTITFAKDDPGFVLTAKNSNNYWGFKIAKSTGKIIDTVNGVNIYAYAIPKQIQFINDKGKNDKEDLKNINMVFIDGQYKSAFFKITKTWYDEDGVRICGGVVAELNKMLKFNNGYQLGLNEVKITDYITAVKTGAKITVTETVPEGYFEKNGKASQTITVKYNDDPLQTVAFNNQKKWAYITIEKIWIDYADSVITDITGLTATFTIVGTDYVEVGVGSYKVKEGTYTVSEISSTIGFKLVSDNNVIVTVAAGENKTVTFINQDPIQDGKFSLRKLIEKPGVEVEIVDFDEWAKGYNGDINEIINGMTFNLYEATPNSLLTREFESGNEPVATSKATLEGVIDFTAEVRARSNFQGYYWIVEELSGDALTVFKKAADPVLVYITDRAIISSSDFDFAAFYTIVNGYSYPGYRNLGYGQNSEYLNSNGDLFYIGVTNASPESDLFETEYASYCAFAGAKQFAGSGVGADCHGYYTSGSLNDANWLSAFNYIEDKYGDLNANRAITQTVIWAILGAVDVNSDLFDKTNLTPAERAAVRDVMANYMNYKGEGKITDVVYLVCENHGGEHGFEYCQPQIVPIYGKAVIINKEIPPTGTLEITFEATLKTITETILQKWQRVVTPHEKYQWIPPTTTQGDSSVTATNNCAQPFIVPNSNHFTYAKLSVADLADGVTLDMVVGNNIERVGTVFVQIVDGKLVLTIDKLFSVGEFGARAFTAIPIGNGNIHSMSGFHDGKYVIDLPVADADGFIYLYIHCNSIKFVITEGNWQLVREWTEEGDYSLKFAKVIKTDIVKTPVAVEFVVTDSNGNVVDSADFGALTPGEYTIVYTDAKGGTKTDIVTVTSGNTVESSYSAKYHEKAEPIIKRVNLLDIKNPLVIHKP